MRSDWVVSLQEPPTVTASLPPPPLIRSGCLVDELFGCKLKAKCHVFHLQMVVQFDDTCDGCGQTQTTNTKELERFVQKFRALSSDELTLATMVTDKEMFNLLAQMIPCVGCRRRY